MGVPERAANSPNDASSVTFFHSVKRVRETVDV